MAKKLAVVFLSVFLFSLTTAISLPVSPASAPLSKADQLEFDTLQVLYDNYLHSSAADKPSAGNDFLERSAKFVKAHPDDSAVWLWRALVAYQLNLPGAGTEAGVRLKALGMLDSDNQTVHKLMVLLNSKGWLDAQAEAVTNSIGMKFVQIKPGSFMMGSPDSEPDHRKEETLHKVTLTQRFFMGQTHVTVAQFRAFVSESGYQTDAQKEGWAYAWTGQTFDKVNGASWRNPGFTQGDDHPVVEISWNDAVAFCQWLNGKESGRTYRLPTEAEYEYCCRAGVNTAFPWGNNPDAGQGWANCADLTAKQQFPTWTTFNWADGYVFTSPVGRYKANAFGLYDMIGNAWEWCNDWYGDYGQDATDPVGLSQGQARVLRGGSWVNNPLLCRCAFRYDFFAPTDRYGHVGFRLALDSR